MKHKIYNLFCVPKLVLLVFLILVFAWPGGFLERNSIGVFSGFFALAEMSPEEERKALEQELKKLEEKISQYESDITKTQQEKNTLQNQIYVLRNKIKKLDAQIYQSNLIIRDLGLQIDDTQVSIEKTCSEIDVAREQLIDILRAVYEEDQKSEIEILLSSNTLSDFFDNLIALGILTSKSEEVLKHVENLKSILESQEQALTGEKEETERVAKIQALQKQESAEIKQEQEYFLRLTEEEYQDYLKKKEAAEKRAAEIRHRLFELIGVPEGGIEFGQAVELAEYVESQTGVRPAFLLAIIHQESMWHGKFGGNVGQCYLKNAKTGEGIIIRTGQKISRVMKPMGLSGRKGDVNDFLAICKELGRDPYNTPVSCPMSFGYGGAMGPAQFIPSTWVLYKNRIKVITGKPADPWRIEHAFLAAALYLKDLGAGSQSYQGELNAALSYFGCRSSWCIENYGKPVMRRAAQYDEDIKELEKVK